MIDTIKSIKRIIDDADKEVFKTLEKAAKSVTLKGNILMCGVPDRDHRIYSEDCLKQIESSNIDSHFTDERLAYMDYVEYVEVPEATIETINRVQGLSVLSCIINI